MLFPFLTYDRYWLFCGGYWHTFVLRRDSLKRGWNVHRHDDAWHLRNFTDRSALQDPSGPTPDKRDSDSGEERVSGKAASGVDDSKDDDEAEEGGDEDEEEEEEMVDPKEKFEEGESPIWNNHSFWRYLCLRECAECKESKACAPAKHHFEDCAARVTAADEGKPVDKKHPNEDCVEECKYRTITADFDPPCTTFPLPQDHIADCLLACSLPSRSLCEPMRRPKAVVCPQIMARRVSEVLAFIEKGRMGSGGGVGGGDNMYRITPSPHSLLGCIARFSPVFLSLCDV